MYTHQVLLNQLKQLNIDSKGILLVHSSMKSIGPVEGGADTVLDVFSEYMAEGLLLFPTHTWATVNKQNPYFNVKTSSVCTGILPELFRNRANTIRSWHPTHSVAALGKDAEAFVAGQELFDTPCHRESVWGKLLDYEATILLIGVDQRRNTFIHGIEEWTNIENRLCDEHEMLYTITPEGDIIASPQRRHLPTHISERYWKVEHYLEQHGAIKKFYFGDARSWICHTVKMTQLINDLLAKDRLLFEDNEPLKRF